MTFLDFITWIELAACVAALILICLVPFEHKIDRFFRNRVEIKTNHYANGHTVTRAVYAWHGGLVSFAVLESHLTYSPVAGSAARFVRGRI